MNKPGRTALRSKKFLKKDHSDSNMMVAIRIRPLDAKEKANKEFEIIKEELKNSGKKTDIIDKKKASKNRFKKILNPKNLNFLENYIYG